MTSRSKAQPTTSLPGAPSISGKHYDDTWRVSPHNKAVWRGNTVLLANIGGPVCNLTNDELAAVVAAHNAAPAVAALEAAVATYIDAGGTGHRRGDEGCGCDQCDYVQAIREAWEALP